MWALYVNAVNAEKLDNTLWETRRFFPLLLREGRGEEEEGGFALARLKLGLGPGIINAN